MLVKSILTVIPNYVMQEAALPVHLYDKIDKISREFMWGSSVEKKKITPCWLEQDYQAKGGRWTRHTTSIGEEHCPPHQTQLETLS